MPVELNPASASTPTAGDHSIGERGGAVIKLPVEETVSQGEAETGTAVTRRIWTAQRVRQAIAAWWTASTTTVGRAVATAVDAAAARTAIGALSASDAAEITTEETTPEAADEFIILVGGSAATIAYSFLFSGTPFETAADARITASDKVSSANIETLSVSTQAVYDGLGAGRSATTLFLVTS